MTEGHDEQDEGVTDIDAAAADGNDNADCAWLVKASSSAICSCKTLPRNVSAHPRNIVMTCVT
jgi:hypothetical protein